MKDFITSFAAALALVVFAVPAQAQVQTQALGPGSCLVCGQWDCDPGDHYAYALQPGVQGPWGGTAHDPGQCGSGYCWQAHNPCSALAYAPQETEDRNRIREILDTMEGEQRVAALLDEYPEHVHLSSDGSAIEVDGAACDEGGMVGRLNITAAQATAVLDAKVGPQLAAAF